MDLAALCAPFSPDRVSWRVGSTNQDKTKGMALAFIDARDVMDRLDEVCGPAGWQCSYPHANGKTVCSIGINVSDGGEPVWVWKADGAGDTDVEAEKGALSDAFKRAAVRWGIGRYLYELPSPWVEIEQKGRSSIITKEGHAKLRSLLTGRQREPEPEPQPAPKAQPELSIGERTGLYEGQLKAAQTQGDVERIVARGARLRSELDKSDPERLAELNTLAERLLSTLPEKKAA